MTDAASIIERFRAEREVLVDRYERAPHAGDFLRDHSRTLDRALTALADLFDLPREGFALVAVGGCGREELYPYSDIDLLILMEDDLAEDAALGERISNFLAELWNFGLPVGASVRSETAFLEEAAGDVSVATTYLEERLLRGDEALLTRALERFHAQLDAKDFFQKKMLELARRHQRYEDTPYSLEPNIKESPGGLRDIQVFLWCAKAAHIATDFRDLAKSGLLSEEEVETLYRVHDFLRHLRINLHLCAKRHEDRMIFDLQEALAQRLGWLPAGPMRASERLMKAYYRNAQQVVQMSQLQLYALSDRLLGDMTGAKVLPIAPGFTARGDEMDIDDPQLFEKRPSAMLETFLVFAEHMELKRMSTRLLRALWHASLGIDDAFRNDPKNHETFLKILQLPRGTYHALKQMNLWGILGRYLLPFRHIVGQMQHDLYHIFTVDQHTLRVVRNIRRFARSDFAHEYPFCSDIMAGLDRNWRLLVAGLFHDIGKGLGGRHEEIGAKRLEAWARSMHFSEEDIDFMCFLVREHLTMSLTAQKRDISDPQVIDAFAKVVKTKERLDALYLLTVADIRATSPKVWNPWKAQLLEALYRTTLSRLKGTWVTPKTAVLERRREVCAKLEGKLSEAERDALWRELDVVYFLRNTTDDIVWHALSTAGHLEDRTPLVRVREHPTLGGLQVLVYTPDQKDLFLRMVAYFGAKSLSIMDARIHTTQHGWALDTLLVTDPFEHDTPERTAQKIERELPEALNIANPIPKPRRGKLSRRSRHFPTRPMVTIVPTASGKAWLLNVICTDRLGLVYDISDILARHNINLQTAKITTLGERVEDVFLIDGPVLRDEATLLAIEAEIIKVLEPAS